MPGPPTRVVRAHRGVGGGDHQMEVFTEAKSSLLIHDTTNSPMFP